MKLFHCTGCGAGLHFDNTFCLTCGRAVGYLQDRDLMSALEEGDGGLRALGADGASYRYCDNAGVGVCNWMIPAEDPQALCESCRHNHMIPDLDDPENVVRWRKIELAKRYVIRAAMRWNLPRPTTAEDETRGLVFDFLNGEAAPVLTGHDHGLITLDVAEGDDAERERRRTTLHEPYRTLVGHFRHEIGHYYWDRLVDEGGRLEECRNVFGDERADYDEALQRHYAEGPMPGWQDQFVTAYATAHPWEDFAETWAHYLHMVDGLETSISYGVAPPVDRRDPYETAKLDSLIEAWVPLTVALNSVNRSLGQPDLYPFVLSEPVIRKLEFIHELVRSPAITTPATQPAAAEAP